MPRLNTTVTVDDLIYALRRSQTPNIVVEGEDDVIIYRELVRRVEIAHLDFHAAGGREKLLRVYERRNEFAHVPVAFIADQDMWLFSGIPADYAGIIWTQGYSIENDLYADAELEYFLDTSQIAEHQHILDALSTWFAFVVEETLAGNTPRLDVHCSRIVPPGQTELDADFSRDCGFRMPAADLVQRIRAAYQLLLRGKLLFQLLVRFLSKPTHGFVRASLNDYALYNLALRMPGARPLLDRLTALVTQKISEQRDASGAHLPNATG